MSTTDAPHIEPRPQNRPRRTAIVVGGGIGGLAAALALRRVGWTAIVLERRAGASEIGAGMSQSPNALRALDALGVGDHARAVGRPFHGPLNVRAPSGRYLLRAAPDTPAPLLGFHRADLHGVLLDALPPSWLRPATPALGARSTATGASVEIDGDRLEADLVVGADGANSVVRRALWPEAEPPRFLGHTVWRAIARAENAKGAMTMGRGAYGLVMPVGGGRVYWALSARAPEPGIRCEDEHAELGRRLVGWHDDLRALHEATPPESVLHHDIHDLAPLPTYVRGRVALLGDAAHLMCPDLGNGAGQAIEDAVVLAAALAETEDIDAALRRYDDERRPRSQFVAREARAKSLANLSPSRAAYALRTAVLTMLPSSRWPEWSTRALAPVWDWTPPRLPQGQRLGDVS